MRLLILIFFLFSSCSYLRFKQEQPEVEVSEASVDTPVISEPVFQPVVASIPRHSGELDIGDLLDISVLGEEELAGSHVAIAPDGRLYYAFLDGIPAAGKSVTNVISEVESALARYLVDPQVAIVPTHLQDTQVEEPSIASHTEYGEGSHPIAIEVSYFPSDEELAYKIFEQTKQTIQVQAGMRDLYRLKFEDQLALAVYGEPSTQRKVAIGKTGDIHFLYLNPVQAEGKTIPELRDEIQEQLKRDYQYAIVLITFVKQ